MIHNLTFNDETQTEILSHLQKTEFLLNKVTSKLSNTTKEATIYAMPDLGLPHNSTRMLGGFYTGAYYSWDCDIPFIPVDSTVNVCGTAVYKLSGDISVQEFKFRLDNVLNNISNYDWNYHKGNHFISLAKSDGKYGLEKGLYMVVHASASEYKKHKTLGLYPEKGNWYYDDIKTEKLNNENRYLRYIEGKTAEKFYTIASFLEHFNLERNRFFCEKVLGNLLEKEILNISHYGMPNNHTVCIGVQWQNEKYTLLTAPSKNIYIVDPVPTNKLSLSPHGLGLQITNQNTNITYLENAFKIGDKFFNKEHNIEIGIDSKNRGIDCSQKELENYVHKILDICPGTITGELQQLCAFSKKGFEIYK